MKTTPQELIRKIVGRAATACSPARPLHLKEAYQPFFIIGAGRSGSTLLRRILMTQGELYVPPETYGLGPSIRSFKRYGYLPWAVLCRVVLSNFSFHKEAETFPSVDFAFLYHRVANVAESQQSLSYIINELYCAFAESCGTNYKMWGDKTPWNVFYLSDVDQVFPDAKYIHVIRDGCDVVSSYLAMGRYEELAAAGDRWTQAVALCRSLGSRVGERYHELRYEDLVTEPEAGARRLCTFLGVPFSPGMVAGVPRVPLGDVERRTHHAGVLGPISRESIGKGRRALTRDQRRALQQRIGRQLEELGYGPASE